MTDSNCAPDMNGLRQRAAVLIEALPYLRRFRGRTLVIKYGGAAMVDADLRTEVLKDIVLLEHVGLHPVVVHGGGPEITEMMARLGKEPEFVDGQRVSDAETVEIARRWFSPARPAPIWWPPFSSRAGVQSG